MCWSGLFYLGSERCVDGKIYIMNEQAMRRGRGLGIESQSGRMPRCTEQRGFLLGFAVSSLTADGLKCLWLQQEREADIASDIDP